MARKKLGLDIGTNSIGWGVLEKEDGKYKFVEKIGKDAKLIPSKGSYIFPKGTEGNERSKAAIRRGFRGARRRIDRIRMRKIATLKILSKHGLCPSFEEGELNRWKNKKIYPCDNLEFIEWQRTGKRGGDIESEKLKQPYYLRYLAATKDGLMDSLLGKQQLGRAFYHIAQRRGYWSNSEDEQTDDKIEQFKVAVCKLLEEHSSCIAFFQPFTVIHDLYKSDKKADSISKKIKKILSKDSSFDNLKEFIQKEFNKKENLGKVEGGIKELSQLIDESGQPTMGSYFYSIYAKNNEDGIIGRIRGRYTDREKHYLAEFDYICKKQNITGDLRNELHNAIFYQRPLKSQKGLVAKCPLETKRKRIAISHPLFEKFRMWESINRIKIKAESDVRLRPLGKDEKELILPIFQRKGDFDFEAVAKALSQGKDYRYIKDRNKQVAEVEFNFPMDKTFTGSPTIYMLRKVLGSEYYETTPFLNTSYQYEKGKTQVSIEDIWHCLFVDSFGKKDKKEARKEFVLKNLPPDVDANAFANIQLKKGYGSLSKSAIKKILPFLEYGELYSHAVFLANVSSVLGRQITEDEKQNVNTCIKSALEKHRKEKSTNGIVNNYIEKCKADNFSLGDDLNSIEAHSNGIKGELYSWFTEEEFNRMSDEEVERLEDSCWQKFNDAAKGKLPKHIEFISSQPIPVFIEKELTESFPNEEILIEKLYHPSAIETYPKVDKELGNPEISSIKNPVFNKAMYQIRRLVNTLIEEGMVDKDTEVNIEMAREINSASYRRALSLFQREQQQIRDWARDRIIECYNESENKIPTNEEITKYILYAEQNGFCLYTGETITPRKFFTEQRYDIEHTIPRSKINDNSLGNKTLANANFNRNYKKDILPANLDLIFESDVNGMVAIDKETILRNRDQWLRSYSVTNNGKQVNFNVTLETLKNDLKKFKKAAKAISDANSHDEIMTRFHYTKLKLDYLQEKYKRFDTEEITSKFTNANLVDTRIITKYARAYLNSYFKKVNVINGQITDTMRKIWGLQGEHEQKDRSNHIHHCIDAITVACVEKGTANRISAAYHIFEKDYFDGNESAKVYLPEPMDNFVPKMKELHKEVLIFHQQRDRIKPLLDEIKKDNPQKLDLRGPLNSQNPYGHRKDENGEYFFVQRQSISKIKEKDLKNILDKRIQERIKTLCDSTGKKVEKLVAENNGYLLLPEYQGINSKGKMTISAPMVIKKVRLKSSKTKLNPYKKIRKLDLSKKTGQEYKHDFYFDKEAGSNYEAKIYGSLIPDNPNGRSKFSNREYRLINHLNIVKDIFEKEPDVPFLFSLRRNEFFLAFDSHTDEIQWNDVRDLQCRLFRVGKFDENGNINLMRHNYALGDINKAIPASEDSLDKSEGVKLKRTPTTLRAIPTKVDVLGRIDIEYSKKFIEVG
nr:type II CRISPR RNA-guided endonuclease Cas9 [uncultured Draconibacterium sp.]